MKEYYTKTNDRRTSRNFFLRIPVYDAVFGIKVECNYSCSNVVLHLALGFNIHMGRKDLLCIIKM